MTLLLHAPVARAAQSRWAGKRASPVRARRKAVERVPRDINRDYWISASEARIYGVIDLIYGQTAVTVSADLPQEAIKVSDEPAASNVRIRNDGLE